jgi:hypothetical protein
LKELSVFIDESYKDMGLVERRRIFNKMMAFIRSLDIRYKCFYIEKKHIEDSVEATGKLSKQISLFVRNHFDEFTEPSKVTSCDFEH